MKIEVDIKRKYFFGLIALILVFSATIAVFAYTKSLAASPDPGHPVNEIGGYFTGNATLDQSLGMFCQADGTNCNSLCKSSGANCVIPNPSGSCVAGQVLQWTGSAWTCASATPSCPSGFVDAGGFCVKSARETGTKNWTGALVDCSTKFNSGRLCSPQEWVIACKKGLLTDAITGASALPEHVASGLQVYTGFSNRNADCATMTTSGVSLSSLNGYRCCADK